MTCQPIPTTFRRHRRVDIAGILAELKRQHFSGNVSIEYEYNWKDNVPDAAQCIGFVRGYGAR